MDKKENEKAVFSKKVLAESKRLREYRDIISVIMADDEKLTIEEAEKRIEKFLKRSV